ncbi:MAG: ROK family protein [Anaerolineales bacterium]
MRTVVGVDVGGTQLRAALFADGDPAPIRHAETLTQGQDGPEAVLLRLTHLISQVVPDPAAGVRIGIGAPGPIDTHRGVILKAPNLPGWVDVPLAAHIAEAFHCPVVVENDANLAALGEWVHGAGVGSLDMLYMTVSTGIGGGVISGGRMVTGHLGLGAEPGHMTVDPSGPMCGCGQPGHLEALASGPALAQRAWERIRSGEPSSLQQEISEDSGLTAEQVGRAAQAGDGLARRIVRETADLIGRHLASLVHIFNPEVIVLGGGVTHIGPLFLDAVRDSLESSVMHPVFLDGLRIVPSALGDEAGLVGAMIRASEL